jgi:phage gp29-like protein
MLLDALGKGYSVAEIRWDTEQAPWSPRDRSRHERAYTWRDPRYFKYDQSTGRELRLLDERAPHDGLALEPWRFIVHEPCLKMGLPIRGGLARLAAVSYMCSTFTLEDWLAFAEVFGMPLRLGRYPDRYEEARHGDDPIAKSAAEAAISTLKAAVYGLGSNAAAVMTDSMRIDFQAAGSGAGGADLFERLADRLDKQISKAVLGRSDAADSTAGKLGGEQFASDVRRDILESDAEELSNTLNEQLVQPFIALNFGPQARYPLIQLRVPDQEDLAGLVVMLKEMVPLGLEVEQSVIRDKWGLPDPDPKGKLLGKPAASELPAQPIDPPNPPPPALNRALNRIAPAETDEIDLLVEDALDDWQPLLAPALDPLQQLADDSASFEDFLAQLPGLLGQMDGQAFIQSLAAAAFKARGLGDGGDR